MNQRIISSKENYKELDTWFSETGCKRFLLVCGKSLHHQEALVSHLAKLKEVGYKLVEFHDFQPNPLYENVLAGVTLFRKEKCDAIIAIGGGSAIDMAKCIKLYSNMDGEGLQGEYLNQEILHSDIPFLAMPTTAGTGSEATRYAVIYYKGKKQSVTSEVCIPDAVLMDSSCLLSLPLYQKKASMCDALCHAIESFWSVKSTDESKDLSWKAIRLIVENMDGYLNNDEEALGKMLLAANIAGKAINITQTTAGHAMCYKITSLFNCAHGHAAMLCDRVLYPWMVENADKCVDPRGIGHLKIRLEEIGHALGCKDAVEGAKKLNKIFEYLSLDIPCATEEQFGELKTSVNLDRLRNHPVLLDEPTLENLYHMILNGAK